MRNLKILHAERDCGIDQSGIVNLDLIEFYANRNSKIHNVSFMRNLKILHISHKCAVNQLGISNLDLVELNISNNSKITNISFMKNLRLLHQEKQRNIYNSDSIELNIITTNFDEDGAGMQSYEKIKKDSKFWVEESHYASMFDIVPKPLR